MAEESHDTPAVEGSRGCRAIRVSRLVRTQQRSGIGPSHGQPQLPQQCRGEARERPRCIRNAGGSVTGRLGGWGVGVGGPPDSSISPGQSAERAARSVRAAFGTREGARVRSQVTGASRPTWPTGMPPREASTAGTELLPHLRHRGTAASHCQLESRGVRWASVTKSGGSGRAPGPAQPRATLDVRGAEREPHATGDRASQGVNW